VYLSIEINQCSAVLYHGTSAIGAHAGSSSSILKWIDEMFAKVGKVRVSGWENWNLLRSAEQSAAENCGVAN
jgi:hypothetical protein